MRGAMSALPALAVRKTWVRLILLAAVVVALAYLIAIGRLRLVSFAFLAGMVLSLSIASPRRGVVALLLCSVFLGEVRRIIDMSGDWTSTDPLLLIVPAFSMLLGVSVLLRERLNTPLARMVMALLAMMAVEIFNPLQGGLSVGLGGAFFYIPPLMFFWLGRRYATPAFIDAMLYRLVLPVAVFAAIVGCTQVFVGFAPWEQAWIDHVSTSYSALNVGGIIRPFAFFTSSAEYSEFMGIAVALAACGVWTGHRRAAVWLLLLVPALFLASGRESLLKGFLAVLVIWAIQRGASRGTYIRVAVGAVVMLTAMTWVLPKIMHDSTGTSKADLLLAHQVGGLLNPTDAKQSTLAVHWYFLKNGVVSGFTAPAGHGLGASTIAAKKFGEGQTATEVDFGDMFVDLGFVGGFLYLAIVYNVFKSLVKNWQRLRDPATLQTFAVMLATILGWLISGEYAIAPIVWFIMGAIDATRVRLAETDPPRAGKRPGFALHSRTAERLR